MGHFLSENIPNLDCGDNCTTQNVLKTTELYNLNERVLCKCHFNKAGNKKGMSLEYPEGMGK